MSSVTILFKDLVFHPYSTGFVLLSLLIWIKLLLNEWDQRYWGVSYQDAVQKGLHWKFLTASVTHSNFIALVVSISCIWNLRVVESSYGPLYMIKCTIMMYFLHLFLGKSLVNYLLRYVPASLHGGFYLTSIFSASSLILAWSLFVAVKVSTYPVSFKSVAEFLLLGFLPLPTGLLPLFLFLVFSFFTPRQYQFSYGIGMMAGLCVGLGLDEAFSESYWMICFLFDCCILFLLSFRSVSSSFSSEDFIRGHVRESREEGRESLQVIECSEYPETPQPRLESYQRGSNLPVPGDIEMAAIHSENGIEGDEDDHQPLLGSTTHSSTPSSSTSRIMNQSRALWRSITTTQQRQGYSQLNTIEDDRDVEMNVIEPEEEFPSRISPRHRNIIHDR